MLNLTLYTKTDCKLCDELYADLQALSQDPDLRHTPFNIQTIDIAGHAEWSDRFRHLVPVLELPNGELRYPPHDYLALRTALLAASGSPVRRA